MQIYMLIPVSPITALSLNVKNMLVCSKKCVKPKFNFPKFKIKLETQFNNILKIIYI